MQPVEGRWTRAALNVLLRVTVKWQHGRRIDLARLRAQMDKLDRAFSPDLPGIRRESLHCDGVAAEWLIPERCRQERVLLYLHGGAFVARTPNLHAAMLAPWCRALNARALIVDYRLAPEHRYPAALDDCLRVYRWLLDQGIKASDLVVAGDSAGGNLALAMLQRARTRNLPMPRCAALLSPFLDFTLSGNSALENAGRDPVFNLAFAIDIRGFYARPHEYGTAGVSPLLGSFDGLPPLLVQVGSSEMLLDDAVRAGVLAQMAGTEARVEIWDRLPHVFQAISALPQSTAAINGIVDFIKDRTGWMQVSLMGGAAWLRSNDRRLDRGH